MFFLLHQRDDAIAIENELLRQIALRKLRQALIELLPGQAVWVYGSIQKSGKFRRESDIDIALEHQPKEKSLYLLQSLLTEATGHQVDICTIEETRLRDKIMFQGQRWTESV